MPASRTSRGNTERRHRGLTCSNCRTRKTRCDGAQPTCKTCDVYGDTCQYDKMPPMSQVVAMATRLQEAESTIAELRQALEARGSPTSENTTQMEINSSHESSTYPHTSPSQPLTPEEMRSDLSLDEKGQICYFGPTSNLHDPPTLQPDSPHTIDGTTEVPESEVRSLLTSNAHESRAWEEFALGNAALQTDIPQAVISQLLQIHWTWIAPNFMWVYRPAFMRDMMTGGQYYSPFLLIVMCAHAARFGGEMKDLLMSRARLLLGTEIHKKSSITTVQALLQLSARDLAYGSISQAWLYSGMAFRMVSDLGLHHSNAKMVAFGHLTAEDLEIRRRLFWSCYFWDKAISLYLGRMPALSDLSLDHSPELLDDYTENELWSPHHGDTLNLSKISVGGYPPMKTHAISCFQNSCKLAIILNDIILRLYSRATVRNADQTLYDIKKRLDEWRAQTPEHLRLDPLNLPDVCPPTNIVSQNMLYYATIVLLHRPFYSTPVHHLQCRNASHCLEKLVLLLEKTFGVTKLTYLIAYCIYTGASVIVQDVKAGDLEAGTKMQTFLRALRGGVTTCPLVQRSIDIITNSLSAGQQSLDTPRASVAPVEDLTSGRYLPAFPLPDSQSSYNSEPSMRDLDFDAFTLLDCFPEYHITSTEAEWYMPS